MAGADAERWGRNLQDGLDRPFHMTTSPYGNPPLVTGAEAR